MRKQYVAYRFDDNSVGVYQLMNENIRHGYMLVKMIDKTLLTNYEFELINAPTRYRKCRTQAEGWKIKEEVETHLKFIEVHQKMVDKIFKHKKNI